MASVKFGIGRRQMSLACPWCNANLDRKTLKGLTRIPQPCPSCGEPIRESMWQVLFTVGLLLPVIALMLYASKWVYELGHSSWSVVVLLGGIVLAVALESFFPTVFGPARA